MQSSATNPVLFHQFDNIGGYKYCICIVQTLVKGLCFQFSCSYFLESGNNFGYIQKCSLDRNVTPAIYSWSSVTSCVHTKQQSYNKQQQPKEQQLTTEQR